MADKDATIHMVHGEDTEVLPVLAEAAPAITENAADADVEEVEDSPPVITIPPICEPDTLTEVHDPTGDNDDRPSVVSSVSPSLAVSPTASAFSSVMTTPRSPGSRSSFDGFPSTPTPSSLSSDRELVAQTCRALETTPAELQMFDLSRSSRKPHRPLKSLRALSDLSNLTHLDVSGNAIERLDGIQSLPKLQTLVLARNHLKALSSSLFTLPELTKLDLSGNFIAHLPRAISGLLLLETLDLSGNNLGKLREVDALIPLANLQTCALAANPFCRLPTYKDYVVCKLRSLERLDDTHLSAAAREKACKRFGAAVFSQDACLREAQSFHEHEQSLLREAQSALEAENLRLKGELQVKSKLLQNKSRAWSSATEQLLQLQQEVAMLNLDRRRPASPARGQSSDAEFAVPSSVRRLVGPPLARPQSASRVPSPERKLERRRSGSRLDRRRAQSQDNEAEGGGDFMDAEFQMPQCSPSKPNERYSSPPKDLEDSGSAIVEEVSVAEKILVDASCSPLRVLPSSVCSSRDEGEEKAESPDPVDLTETAVGGEMLDIPLRRTVTPRGANATSHRRKHSESFDQVRRAFAELVPATDDDKGRDSRRSTVMSVEMGLQEDESLPTHEHSVSRSARFPTFEDDVACPAYEDPALVAEGPDGTTAIGFQHSSLPHDTLATEGTRRTQSVPASPSSLSRLRQWFRQQNEFQNTAPSSSPKGSLRSLERDFVPPALQIPFGQVDRDSLTRQIQALQSCKQSLLTEIGNEEQVLHVLKQESGQYLDQIDRLSVNIQACLDGDPTAVCFSTLSPPTSPRSSNIKKKREEATCRARLDMLRSKLRFAEDKEKEIESTMVRMTKRVLQYDLNGSADGSSCDMGETTRSRNVSFDKEIFALTHKLQLVIVQKEDIHMQMSQLMAQVRDQQTKVNTTELGGDNDALEDGSISAEQVQALAKSRQMVDELRTRHHEVTDRIAIKERHIASLIDELKEVEAELQHISQLNLSPARSPLVQRERAASIDFFQSMRTQFAQKESHTDANASGEIVPEGEAENGAGESPSSATNNQHQPGRRDSRSSEGSSFPFKLQFKELMTAEMLEEIKAEIYEKLSHQLAATSGKNGEEGGSLDGGNELHHAIATALETHLKAAMDDFQHKHKLDDSRDATNPDSSPRNDSSGGNQAGSKAHVAFKVSPKADEVCWDHIDEFAPVEAHYAKKYAFVKDQSKASASSPSGAADSKVTARLAGTQRILKACERLEIAQTQCKLDPISSIELDPLGNNRSSLKILLLAARDLPTAHLRTKNLDPYVTFEVVYPSHVVSPSSLDAENKVLRSRTKKKSIYPVWDEDFEIAPVLSLNGYIHVRVLNDRRLSREQLVGETRIPLHALVHQKRVVEWFSLGLTVQPAFAGTTKVVSKLCGGAVRLQLQLSFSSVERLKRTVDDLVTRFLHDHNQLPPFIEPVNKVEDLNKTPEQPEQSEMTQLYALREEIEAIETQKQKEKQKQLKMQKQQAESEAPFPLDELETSLPAYNVWKKGECSDSQTEQDQQDTASASQSRGVTSAQAIASGSQLSLECKKSPWEATPSLYSKSTPTTPTSVAAGKQLADVSTSTGHTRPLSSSGLKSSSSAPRHTSRASPGLTKIGNGLQQHSSLRRKAHAQENAETPECFDEYSPYHPAFRSADPLESCNNEMAVCSRKQRASVSFHHPSRVTAGDRKTDLRIFKSPSFARRTPTTGFPERYIGLDNQTCERLKRIFGRMDASTNGSS